MLKIIQHVDVCMYNNHVPSVTFYDQLKVQHVG